MAACIYGVGVAGHTLPCLVPGQYVHQNECSVCGVTFIYDFGLALIPLLENQAETSCLFVEAPFCEGVAE
jgi:hypothetical protein